MGHLHPSAEAIFKEITNAKSEILVQAYSFTSTPIPRLWLAPLSFKGEFRNPGAALISWFGKFSVRKRAPRKGRNPAIGAVLRLDVSDGDHVQVLSDDDNDLCHNPNVA
jgi:hypothetical protein